MSVQVGIAGLRLDNNAIARIVDSALEDVPRAHEDSASFDLWCKNITGLPDTAMPVLVHEVFCQVEWFEQIIWFNRTDTHDQLYVCTGLDLMIAQALHETPANGRRSCLAGFGPHAACAMSVRRERSYDKSLLELVAGYFSTQAGAPGGIEHSIATAYINKRHFELILERVEAYRLQADGICQRGTNPYGLPVG